MLSVWMFFHYLMDMLAVIMDKNISELKRKQKT